MISEQEIEEYAEQLYSEMSFRTVDEMIGHLYPGEAIAVLNRACEKVLLRLDQAIANLRSSPSIGDDGGAR
jgi:hypothetical protein